jgi:hypothetical protein
MDDEKIYEYMRCDRKIARGEYETYNGLCEECQEIEIDELDYEDDC